MLFSCEILKVHCIFLDGNQWSKRGIGNGVHDDKTAECITNHLTSFSMVVLDAKVKLILFELNNFSLEKVVKSHWNHVCITESIRYPHYFYTI
jgi:hypothetical protein